MKRAINILAVIFIIQVALVFGLRLTGGDTGEFSGQQQLLQFSAAQIDQLLIENGEGQKIVLKKQADQWILPDYADAAADTEKLTSMLSDLANIKRNWPVAETADAIKRFKVADDSFERRLTFKNDDKDVAILLLGSSPGFKKVHARLQSEDKVFDIPFSTYQASLKTADWINKQVLHLNVEQVAEIEFPDVSLQQNTDGLFVPDLAENEQLDQDQAKKVLEQISKLSVLDVEPGVQFPETEADLLSINVVLSDGNSRQYRFFKQGDRPLLKVSGNKQAYKISDTLFEEVKKANRQSLLRPVEKSDETESEKAPDA
jgi:hypothetical protein